MEVSGLEGNRSPGGAPFQQNKHQIENIAPKMLLVLHNAQQFMRLHDFPGINILFLRKFSFYSRQTFFSEIEKLVTNLSPLVLSCGQTLNSKKAGTDTSVSDGVMEDWR
jgi:hypothetical protein